jgi:hypothetical protein
LAFSSKPETSAALGEARHVPGRWSCTQNRFSLIERVIAGGTFGRASEQTLSLETASESVLKID